VQELVGRHGTCDLHHAPDVENVTLCEACNYNKQELSEQKKQKN
jgi:hypothetical protein